MNCKKCGSPLAVDAKTCSACGEPVVTEAAPTPAPTAGPTPAPTAGPTPAPTAGPAPAPMAGPAPAPMAGPTPAPMAGPTPAPMTGPIPAPMAGPIPGVPPIPGSVPAPETAPVVDNGKDGGKKNIIIIAVVAVVALIAGGLIGFIIGSKSSSNSSNSSSTSSNDNKETISTSSEKFNGYSYTVPSGYTVSQEDTYLVMEGTNVTYQIMMYQGDFEGYYSTPTLAKTGFEQVGYTVNGSVRTMTSSNGLRLVVVPLISEGMSFYGMVAETKLEEIYVLMYTDSLDKVDDAMDLIASFKGGVESFAPSSQGTTFAKKTATFGATE